MDLPPFLRELLDARSPTGHEYEAQRVYDKYVEPRSDGYLRDSMGNRIGILNTDGSPTLLLAGHMDELGLIITYVDKDGFLYFDTLGGHDLNIISGRRVRILTKNGPVTGVTGKRAIHLMEPDERKKAPERHNLWIDIGAKDKAEALRLVRIGDPVVYDHGFEPLRGTIGVSRAFDNKVGAYIAGETLIRLSALSKKPKCKLAAVATTQEEIGCRGARIAAHQIQPDLAVAIDVTHATDHPECNNRKFGEVKLGGGPVLSRGPNINPWILDRLVAVAEAEKITIQFEAEARPIGNDSRELQWSRDGVATASLGVPLRYMHTPSEVVDLQDVENCVRLLVAFAQTLEPGDKGVW